MRAIFDAIGDAIFVADLTTGRLTEVNECACRMFGYRRDEFIGSPVAALTAGVPPYTEDAIVRRIRDARAHGPQLFEWHAKTKAGTPIWVEISLRCVEFGAGPVLMAVVRDINERKRNAQDTLETYTALAEAEAVAHVGSFILDLSNRRMRWTDECFRILGLTPKSITPAFETYLARVHPDDRAALIEAYDRSLLDRTPGFLEQRVVLPDGTVRIIRTRWQNVYGDDNKPLRTIGAVQDITESKTAENALKAERDFSAAVIDSLPGFFALLDDRGRFLRYNKNLADFAGLSAEQLRGRDYRFLIAESDRAEVAAKIEDAFRTGHADAAFRMRNEAGALRFFHWSGRSIAADGAAQLLAVGVDISELRDAQVASQQSEQRLATILNSVSDGIGVHDPQSGAFVEVNSRLCEMFGYSRDEMLKRGLADLSQGIEPYTDAGIRKQLERLSAGQPSAFEWRAKAKDGHTFWIEISAKLAQFGGRQVLLSVVRDIGQRKHSEEALAYRDRILNAITTGIAALTGSESLELGMNEALRIVGETTGVDRVYLLQMEATPGGLPDVKYSWHGPGIDLPLNQSTVAASTPSNIRAAIAAWNAPLYEGKPVATHRSTAAEPIRRIMENAKNQSMLMLPIFVAGRFWGAIGVDACRGERPWTATETETLQIFAEIVGTIIVRNDAQEAVRVSQARYRALVETTPDWVWEMNEQLSLTYVSPQSERLLGYTADELLGHSPLEYMTEEDAKRAAAETADLFGNRRPMHEIVGTFVHKSGRQVIVETNAVPLYDAAGHYRGYRGVGRDVTERKRTADALAYRDRILNAITNGTAALVAGDPIEAGMAAALKIVGEAIDVDRVNLLQFQADLASVPIVKSSWYAPSVDPLDQSLIEGVTPPDVAAELLAWHAPLRERAPVITYRRSAVGPVRKIMEGTKNQSMLRLPIFVGGNLWGTIGVDVCRTEHEWTPTEIETLRIFSDVVGVVIMRNGTRESLQKSEERFRAVSETAQDAIIMIDAAGRIEYWNHAAERLLGYGAAEAKGKTVHEWLAPERFRDKAVAGMEHFAATGHGEVLGKTLELAAIRKDGVEIPVEVSVAAMLLDSWHAIGMLRDISERKRAEAELAQMARTDTLTGLNNRRVFVEALEQAVAVARRDGQRFAVLYLDLDHFKDINDALGHPVGDLLLMEMAERLRSRVREGDTIARFGGDEFALLANAISDPMDAADLAQSILNLVTAPSTIEDKQIRIGASIGISYWDREAPSAEVILSQADIALYKSKNEGRGTYRFFTTAMDAEVRDRVALGAELREAIASDQLFLLYQPQVDVDTGRIIGLEALVRWKHPTRGVVAPDQFIPITEHIGLIVPLGRWVVRNACRQMRAWRDAGIAPPFVAVNVSAAQFTTPLELERDITAILAETGLQPENLELELTETVLMTVSREHSDDLARLRASGLHIAIDDFGTGYSSLAYLSRLPVNRIKIAQSFIRGLTANSANAAIVRAAIGVAHELGLDVVVEGVETAEELELVKSWDAHKVQGFYFARPLPADEIALLLAAGNICPE